LINREINKHISLRNSIFILNALVIVITLATMGYFASRISSQAIIDKAIKSSDRELVLIDRNLNTMLDGVEDYSRILSLDNRLQIQLSNLNEK